MRKTSFIGMLLILPITHVCTAQQSVPSPQETNVNEQADATDPNLVAIRTGSQAFVDAFNKADAAAVANTWSINGEYIDDVGTRYVGRAAIQKAYAEYFRENSDAKIQLNIDSLRLVSESAAIEEGYSLVEVPPVSAAIGRYLVVHVKVNGKWQMASVRDEIIETAAAQQNVSDLDWLIGTWVAEEYGSKNESICRWVSNQHFVQRDFTITSFDGTKSSGTQLIGWNPQAGYVQSWTFSPDGGHAIGDLDANQRWMGGAECKG